MSKSLFHGHLIRSTITAGLSAICAHVIVRLIPGSFHIFTHSVVTFIALGSLATVVLLHHKRDGQVLTDTQEEFILIGIFGLFWFAMLEGFRSFSGGPGDSAVYNVDDAVTRGEMPYPCGKDDVWCVVEEQWVQW